LRQKLINCHPIDTKTAEIAFRLVFVGTIELLKPANHINRLRFT
jgi:hypothetical protein